MKRLGRRVVPAVFGQLLLFALISASPGLAAPPQVPFGDAVSAALTNYNRTTPSIATGGLLKEGALEELKDLGFTAILDLRSPEEGIAEEQAGAKTLGLKYFNVPVSAQTPTEAQVAAFAAIVEDESNLPIMVHCVSANRAGAMWSLYRAAKGVPLEIAIEEGRTVGLKPSRENAVRAALGMPPIME